MPVIAYQMLENVKLIPNVCVGAREQVKSVCLVTKGEDLQQVKSVSLDVSSKTSVALTKIIFREFLGFEPLWKDSAPNLENMLSESDCALLIGDPALLIDENKYQKFDLAELWREFTGFGFVFAMWMTRNETCKIDFASARNEGLAHLDEIISNYKSEIPISREDFHNYLTSIYFHFLQESIYLSPS